MIRTKLAYGGQDIIINPYTVSYIIESQISTNAIIAFTNGHTIEVTASLIKLQEVIEYETKSLCKECTRCAQTQDNTNR